MEITKKMVLSKLKELLPNLSVGINLEGKYAAITVGTICAAGVSVYAIKTLSSEKDKKNRPEVDESLIQNPNDTQIVGTELMN